ncbi:magnesium transporter CorA family protein [Jeotgalibaca ciconiae]|uniref:Magnesium transporter CorA family protein n=1 Tax=Jeotgalibaca ciconiae TaxID=2496265 RepID=A0A3Q9BLX0_9LACT|nr:magnesium transporter CorA family protein [Jeotgalibaca ciconiae]AZP05383.1 magnesium transporter CorA family protein [Jeotgalibaca ciconiae]HJB22742.1 magnesium transporter CorA family protein [Candidatus Jeotgalibaca pullicola]
MKAFRLENQAYVSTDSIEEAELVLCEDPSQEEIDYLHNQYDIPLDFITDGLNRYMVPRKENYETDNHELIQLLLFLYPLVKIDEADRLEYQTLPLSIIILNGKMIMVYPKELPFLERTINQNNQSEESLFLLQILWQLTNEYVKAITRIDDVIENMEQNLVNSTKNEAFYKMISINKTLVYFETGITKNHEIIDQVYKKQQGVTEKLNNELLHDIRILSNQARVMRRESDEMISHLSEVFSSVISNNLNNIMKFLTSLTIVMTIPTIIGSYWGMNVSLPFEKNLFAFALLVFASIIIGILTVFWLKKKDYL